MSPCYILYDYDPDKCSTIQSYERDLAGLAVPTVYKEFQSSRAAVYMYTHIRKFFIDAHCSEYIVSRRGRAVLG